MYSGSTLTNFSGSVIGAHQKIDRLAHKLLNAALPEADFPSAKSILHFEGRNGPDAIKRKSPAKDEPWHYLQPHDLEDTQLIELIEDHYKKLIKALKTEDQVRASFEAAWLAHAIVDGLTPAHHFPYEEALMELSCGREKEERTTIGKKIIMPGESKSHQISNNWKMWGPKGVFTTHAGFEWGVAMLMAPIKSKKLTLTKEKIAEFEDQSVGRWFRQVAQEVADLHLYDSFYLTGWNMTLAQRIKKELAPTLVQSVALVWYGAVKEAGLKQAA